LPDETSAFARIFGRLAVDADALAFGVAIVCGDADGRLDVVEGLGVIDWDGVTISVVISADVFADDDGRP
jgi:hypothetical protein